MKKRLTACFLLSAIFSHAQEDSRKGQKSSLLLEGKVTATSCAIKDAIYHLDDVNPEDFQNSALIGPKSKSAKMSMLTETPSKGHIFLVDIPPGSLVGCKTSDIGKYSLQYPGAATINKEITTNADEIISLTYDLVAVPENDADTARFTRDQPSPSNGRDNFKKYFYGTRKITQKDGMSYKALIVMTLKNPTPGQYQATLPVTLQAL